MSTAVKSKIRRSYVHVAIMLIIMVVVGMLPPIGDITPLGMRVLGVFLGIVYGWCFIDLLFTSLFGFFALSMTGYMTISQAFQAALGNESVIIILICFVFAECVNQLGVSNAIAFWALGRKIFIGRSWLFIFGVTLLAFILSLFGGTYAAIFLLWAVISQIADINGIPKNNILLSMLSAIIVYSAFTAYSIVPFGPSAILYCGFLTEATGFQVPALPLILSGTIYGIVTFAIMFFISKVFLKADAHQFRFTEELSAKYSTFKMNKVQKAGLVLLLVYFIGLMASFTLTGGIWTTLAAWGIIGFSVIYILIFCVWKDEEGKPYCTLDQCFKNGIVWDTLVLFAVTMPLSAAMESDEVGITSTIHAFCSSVFSGFDLTVMIIIILVVIGALTQVMHNVVLGAIFIPIFAPIVMEMGGNPIAFFFMFYLVLQAAYATPAGSMMAALIFGKKDIPVKHSYTYGIMFWLVSEIVLIALMPLWNVMF